MRRVSGTDEGYRQKRNVRSVLTRGYLPVKPVWRSLAAHPALLGAAVLNLKLAAEPSGSRRAANKSTSVVGDFVGTLHIFIGKS
jgi:hypothetical protein